MRTFKNWRSHQALRSTRFCPRLESLEDRTLLSVATTPFGGEFIRYNDGEVFFHTPGSFQKIDVNSMAISAGQAPGGLPAVFILYNNSDVFEWTQAGGFHFIDVNAVAISASVYNQGLVFILYGNGQLFQYDGGFTFVAGAVAQFSAGLHNAEGAVFYVQTNHMLSEWSLTGGLGSKVIDGNVASVSSTQNGSDEAFIIYTNGQLYEATNTAATPSFRYIDDNVFAVGGGTSSVGGLGGSAYYLTTNGILIEWQPPTMSYPDGTYNYIDSNVASFTGGYSVDQVFIVYPGDVLYQHTGVTRVLSSFVFIDSNVAP
jgi:hypothetical protein